LLLEPRDIQDESKLPSVTRGLWQSFVRDNDGPQIEALRRAYLLYDKMYEKMLSDLFMGLQNPLLTALTQCDIEEIPVTQRLQWQAQLQSFENAHAHQSKTMDALMEKATTRILGTLQTPDRLHKDALAWKSRIALRQQNFSSTLEEIRRTLAPVVPQQRPASVQLSKDGPNGKKPHRLSIKATSQRSTIVHPVRGQ
jgi:hypothetical protein